jgi:RHS repeat-associated protein
VDSVGWGVRWRRIRARRPDAGVVALAVLVAGAAVVLPAAERPMSAPVGQRWDSVTGKSAAPVTVHRPDPGAPWAAGRVAWPRPGEATLDLATERATAAARGVPAGTLPVRAAKDEPAGPSRIRVALADRDASRRAGVDGLLFRVRPDAGAAQSGRIRVWVDPTPIAGAYGGDWANRLRLVGLPACALTTPQVDACRTQEPLPTERTPDDPALTALVDVPASAGATSAASGVFALTAGAAGTSGDYGATPLKPSGSWSAGSSSGDFGYSYPIDLPPVPAKLVPSVALSYSAQSVDGQQVATNNQSSVIGDGWSYSPGSIQRTYRSCSDDPNATWPKTPDSCWAGQIVTVSFGGGSGDLVYDPSVPTQWKISNDDNAKVELLTGADNGAHNGEYWKITMPDGTQYFFGRNKLPGFQTGNTTTNSAWSQRVYSPRSTDPCYSSAGFASSHCNMAWKWNLDYVVDTHRNAIAYYYGAEKNNYGANQGTSGVAYTRGGWLERIEYGLRDPNPYASAPARVQFTHDQRCVESAAACAPGNIDSAPTKWPDTPYDLNCKDGVSCHNHAPTFWTRLRLTNIATQVFTGTGYTTVDSYTLAHSFPDPQDGTTPALWLASIQHTGSPGPNEVRLPAVTFDLTRLPNRADGIDGAPAMNHPRISTITTETGSVVAISYRTECSAPVTVTPSQNTTLCYPVYWTQEGRTDPTLDWFHKYVVTEVVEQDPTGRSVPVTTAYEYLDGGAWRLDDNELVKEKHRTYGQWRGFGRVRTRKGAGTDQKTLSETIYYRGMDGDRLPGGGRRTATVQLSGAVTVPGAAASVPDTNELAGSVRQTLAYNGDGGPVHSATVNDYWVSPARASRSRTGLDPLTANMTRQVSTRTTTAITSTNPTTWRTTRTDTTYDTATGLPTVVYDYGDVTRTDQSVCTVTGYAPANTAAHIVNLVAEVETLAKPCGGSGVNGLTAPASVSRPADVISRARTFYDDPTFSGAWPQAPPTVGDPSMLQEGSQDAAGAFVFVTTAKTIYDQYGRPTRATDANDTTATTTYTTVNGLTTQVVATNPLQHSTTTRFDPTRGLSTGTTDANGLQTTLAYDGLGRLTGMWRPGRATNLGANLKVAYTVSQSAPSTITTSTLNDNGSYRVSIALYDALTRPRQTQAQTPTGGRVVTDTFYDSRGWPYKSNNEYYDTAGGPSTTLLDMVGRDQQIPNQELYNYDGVGRKVAVVSQSKGQVKWQTRIVHGGDRTTVLPPEGGTPTTTIVDALGRKTEVDSYTSQPIVAGTVVSGGSPVKITYGYDRRGRENRITDDAGNSWTKVYDVRGRVLESTDPDAGTSTSTYDNNGNLLSSTNSLGQKTSYTYDALGRKTARYDGEPTGQPVATWTYDSTGITNGIGALASSTANVNGVAYTVTTNGYNNWGSPLGVSVTIPIAPGNGALAGTYTFSNTYSTTSGLLTKTTFPNAGGLPAETVNRTYTTMDLPSGVGSGLGPYVDSTTYNPFGKVSQTKFGFGTTNVSWRTNIYDEHTQRLVNTYIDRTGTGATRISDLTYDYTPSGKITKQTEARNSGASRETQCFRYNLLGRLTTAWTATDNCAADLAGGGSNATVGGINPYWTSWTYNTVGDRTREVEHALPGSAGVDTVTDYVYGSAQPHTLRSATTTGPTGTALRTFDYDAGGNTTTRTTPARDTQTFTWDRQGRLTGVSTGSTTNAAYVYDADGNMLVQRNPSANTVTLYLPGQELTLNTSTNVVSGKRYYTAPDGTVCVRTGTTAAAYSYLFSDHLGTGTLTLNNNGQNPTWRAFTPYGGPRGPQPASWPDKHGYLGKPTDSTTGLTILGARHYDPDVGRFISVDPLLDATDPNQIGGYTYAGDDPVNRSDPDGLNAYDSQTPCAKFNCGPGNYDRSDTASPNATNTAANGWTPPKQPKPSPKTTPAPKKKKQSWWDKSVNWAKNHSQLVGAVAGIAAGIAVGAACTALSFGFGAVGCAVLAGAVGGAIGGAVTHGLDVAAGRADGGWKGWAGAVVGGAVIGAAAGLVGAVAAGAAFGGAVAWSAGLGLKAVATGAKVGAKAAFAGGSGGGAAGSAARKACNSFEPATPVLLANGATKAIKDVRVGDTVLATDPKTGRTEPKSVVGTIIGRGEKVLVDVTVDVDGPAGNGQATVVATYNHAFWTTSEQRWTPAALLKPGHLLRTAGGRQVSVLAVEVRTQRLEVRNLTVNDIHTYYVMTGDTPVLVHNDVDPYDVGTYDDLKRRSAAHDGLDIHHLPQKHPAGQVIPGYDKKTGPAIAVPADEHRQIPTRKGTYTGTGSDLVAGDLDDLAKHTNAPASAIDDIRAQINKQFPNLDMC